MRSRWAAGPTTIGVLAVAVVLVVLDVVDRGVRHFWATHALTTDIVAGLVVLALTLLVVNQVINRRQAKDRSRVVAAQALILVAQAQRSVKAVVAARDEGADRQSAADELRTYLLMLLVGAPVLIDAPVSRRFLDQAQRLAGELARVLAPDQVTAMIGGGVTGGLDEAITGLRAAATPLIAVLTADEQSSLGDAS